jgi:hypothetical protein
MVLSVVVEVVEGQSRVLLVLRPVPPARHPLGAMALAAVLRAAVAASSLPRV